MGKFDPSTREIKLITGQFLEAAKLLGTAITIKFIASAEWDLYKDPTYTHRKFQELDVILNERPNKYLLDSYGWYNEDDEVVPMIMYVSKFDQQGNIVKPLTGSVLVIPYELAEDEILERVYVVSNAVLTNPGAWMWVCKITPYREPFENDPDINETEFHADPNYNFLNVKK